VPLIAAYGSAIARHADGQCAELIDRAAANSPIRKLLFVEAFGHRRMPSFGRGPDHRPRIELTTIDARAAEPALTSNKVDLSAGLTPSWS
jgi:hypothetical protein